MKIQSSSETRVEGARLEGARSDRAGGATAVSDAEAFALSLASQSSTPRPDAPGAPADWPLVGRSGVEATTNVAAQFGSAGATDRGAALRETFQRAAEEAVARVRHDQAFAPPPPPVFPAAQSSNRAFERSEEFGGRAAGGSIWRGAPSASGDPRPTAVAVDSPDALDAVGGEPAAAAAGRDPFAVLASKTAADADAPSQAVSISDALAASEQSVRAELTANVERDGAALPVASAMRADLERAADDLAAADGEIGAMIDGMTKNAPIDPATRSELIVQAREEARQKMRDIARAIGPDKPAPAT